MRSAIRLLLLLTLLLLLSPFLISSLLVDQRGVIIPAHVFSKDETISVHYTSWTRTLNVVAQYDPPDGYGVAFLNAQLTPEQFDSLKKGDRLQLRYLLEKDLPDFPGARTMRQMHVLPTVRLADHQTWSGLQQFLASHGPIVTAVLTAGLVLFVWRLFRVPFFAWGIATCVLLAIGISLFAGFPKPTQAPSNGVRSTTGIIKSLGRYEWLFRERRSRGVRADQPIEVAGVQFVPEGRTEPVVAVDLIDAGSLPGLHEHVPVTVEYEIASPRVAYIRGATRDFVRRNLEGLVTQGIATLVVVVGFLAVAVLLRKGFRKLVERRSP